MADTHIKIKPVTPRVQYTANGSTTVFPYSFAIFDESDMVVYVDDDIITTGYTVSGAGQTDGGNVTFDTAPESGKKITLLRNVPIERITDFQEGGTFRPKNLNDEFDRQTAFAQQVQEALTRCVKVDPTSSTNPEDILPKVEELYDDLDNINAVAADLTNIDAVVSNQTNIDAVAGNETNINTVAGDQANIDAVAGSVLNVDTVANDIANVNTCAGAIASIIAAPTAATNASNSASAAALSASQAAISAAGTHFKLFQHGWFDYELNDMAWLRADTFSWQDGTVYTNAYNHLVDDLGTITGGENFYAWREFNEDEIIYTKSSTPLAGDNYYNNEAIVLGEITEVGISGTTIHTEENTYTRDSNYDFTSPMSSSAGATQQTETVGSYTITYWLAADGHKICLPDQETTAANIYTESGVAWYYILDTTNQRFKLPRELPITDKSKGNGIALGFTDGNGNNASLYNGLNGGGSYYGFAGLAKYGSKLPKYADSQASLTTDSAVGITTDPTKSGIISHRANENGQQYLYFYVGQFSQSATEQTAGLNSELFNGKVDLNAANLSTAGKSLISGLGMPSNRYIDLTLGASGSTYTAPANGWVMVGCTGTAGSTYFEIVAENLSACASYNGGWGRAMAPIKKNQTFTCYYGGTGFTKQMFRFCYAEGETNV